jgi:hypothetical protein
VTLINKHYDESLFFYLLSARPPPISCSLPPPLPLSALSLPFTLSSFPPSLPSPPSFSSPLPSSLPPFYRFFRRKRREEEGRGKLRKRREEERGERERREEERGGGERGRDEN